MHLAMTQSLVQFREVLSSVPAMSTVIAAILLFVCPVKVPAQLPQIPGAQQPGDEPDDDLQRLPTERRVVQQLNELTKAAGQNDIATVRDLLEMLRTADPMLLVPGKGGTYVPLHRDLIQRFQKLPSSIVDQLQLDSPESEAALQKGLSSEGVRGLIPVLHRYSGTQASLKAHLLLAAMHGDRGHLQAAEYWLVPVIDSRTAPVLQSKARQLKARFVAARGGEAESGSDQPSLERQASDTNSLQTEPEDLRDVGPSEKDPPEAVQNSRDESPSSAQILGTAPSAPDKDVVRHLHWMQSLPLPAKARRLSQDLVQGSSEHRILPWSAWEPVVDDQKIYVRAPSLISAFDRRSGQHVWTRAISQKKETAEDMDDDMPMFRLPMDENALNAAINSAEIQLLHRNELVGRMSADASRLFAVCQIGEATPTTSASGAIPMRILIGRGERLTAGLWELIAIDKESGRRLWTMGGPPVEARFGNQLAMAWFAGPPAVCGNQLFGVVERSGVIQLMCASAETGQLNWIIPLAYPETEIALDPARQILSARILAEAGLVFTTTTTGWIFAVDSVTHSVLWARRLPAPQSGGSRLRSFRNPAIFQPQTLPLGQVWRSETPLLCKETLVVASAESRQLMVMNPLDGQIRSRPSADGATLVLYMDSDLLVVASAQSTVAWRLPAMKKLWTKTRKRGSPVPVGHSVKFRDLLLLPMSDGSLASINPEDGSSVANLAGLRPSFSSGGLFPAGPDVVSYGPNHLALLSSAPADRLADPDPFQQAAFLVETGRLADAREILTQISVDALNVESLRRLRFRIAAGLFASGEVASDVGLQEIAAAAQTLEEKALSKFLNLEHLLKSSPAAAVQPLMDALKIDDAVLSVEIPETNALYATLRTSTAENPLAVSSLTSGQATLRWPLRSWILNQLNRIVAEADNDGKAVLVRSLSQLSDEDVLGLHSAELATEYLRRATGHIEAGMLQESTLHLVLAASLSDSSSEERRDDSAAAGLTEQRNDIFDELQKLSEESFRNDPGQLAIIRHLLQVLRKEQSRNADLDGFSASAATQDAIVDQWIKTGDLSYTMLPVSTVGHMSFRTPNVRPLETRTDGDPILSAFDWSLRREPGALIARSATNPELPPWSLKTTVAENAFLQSDEEVMRFGSVMILQNMMGLSAYSVVDQRWLWSRRMPGGLRRSVMSIMNRPFRDFNAISNGNMIYGQGRRICGATNRWICLISDGTLEVVDLLNGRRLWAMSGFEGTTQVFACDSVICAFGTRAKDCLTLNPANGSAEKASVQFHVPAAELGMRTLCSSGNDLVVWNSGTFANKERSIDWIDSRTGNVTRTVELPDMEYAQFLNPETLVALTDEQTFHVVSLKTGERQTLSYAGDTNDGELDLPVQRIAIAADAANYYVFEQAEGGLPMMAGTMYGIRAEVIKKELRAVNRRSGTLAWVLPAKDDMMACIRGSSDPVMLIVRIVTSPQANQGAVARLGIPSGQRYLIDGISRTTGQTLLTYPVVAQAPFPSLRLSSKSNGQLELEAFGNRVRFLPTSSSGSPENQ